MPAPDQPRFRLIPIDRIPHPHSLPHRKSLRHHCQASLRADIHRVPGNSVYLPRLLPIPVSLALASSAAPPPALCCSFNARFASFMISTSNLRNSSHAYLLLTSGESFPTDLRYVCHSPLSMGPTLPHAAPVTPLHSFNRSHSSAFPSTLTLSPRKLLKRSCLPGPPSAPSSAPPFASPFLSSSPKSAG